MSESVATAGHASARKPAMSVFERYLTFWVALCIVVGIALGQLLPGVFPRSAKRRWRRSTCRSPCWSG